MCKARSTSLFAKSLKVRSWLRWFTPAEAVFFASLAAPAGYAAILVLTGGIAPDGVDWIKVAANIAVLVVLGSIWNGIQKINRAALLQL